MKVAIRQILGRAEEQVIIECVKVTRDIEDIQRYALAKGTALTGMCNERVYRFELEDVLYFEAVDERVFAYTKEKVYEVKVRLYELEAAYSDKSFVRCSKAFLINLMKIESISPALNGRFMAHMQSGEKIIVSRQYAGAVKLAVLGGK